MPGKGSAGGWASRKEGSKCAPRGNRERGTGTNGTQLSTTPTALHGRNYADKSGRGFTWIRSSFPLCVGDARVAVVSRAEAAHAAGARDSLPLFFGSPSVRRRAFCRLQERKRTAERTRGKGEATRKFCSGLSGGAGGSFLYFFTVGADQAHDSSRATTPAPGGA